MAKMGGTVTRSESTELYNPGSGMLRETEIVVKVAQVYGPMSVPSALPKEGTHVVLAWNREHRCGYMRDHGIQPITEITELGEWRYHLEGMQTPVAFCPHCGLELDTEE